MQRTYQRSQILSYWELEKDQQAQAVDQCDERAEGGQYVLWTAKDGSIEVLPLEMFMRVSGPSLFHGVYGQGYYMAYMIKINRTGEEATVAACTW